MNKFVCVRTGVQTIFPGKYNLLRSSKNAFIMQSKSTFLEFLRGIHRYKFGHPKKFFRGEIIQGKWRNFHRARALFLTGVEFHVLPCVLVWCQFWSKVMMSEKEERPRFVTGGTGGTGVNGLIKTKIPSFCLKPRTIYPTQSIDGS